MIKYPDLFFNGVKFHPVDNFVSEKVCIYSVLQNYTLPGRSYPQALHRYSLK